MSWYSDPWFIGVVSGIPSGLIVNWASKYVLGKRENREYLQKTVGANREIIYAVRPGISEGEVPSREVLTALTNATARRFGVETTDLYTPQQISEELIKEVMDSSFISTSQKAQFCHRLAQLAYIPSLDKRSTPSTTLHSHELTLYRMKVVESISRYLGFLTSVLAVAFSVFAFAREGLPSLSTKLAGKNFHILLPALIAPAIVAGTLALYAFVRDLKRSEAERRRLHKQPAMYIDPNLILGRLRDKRKRSDSDSKESLEE